MVPKQNVSWFECGIVKTLTLADCLAFATQSSIIVEFVQAILWLQRMACPAILWDVQGTGQCELPVLEGWGGRMPEKNKSTTCVEGLGEGGRHDFAHVNTFSSDLEKLRRLICNVYALFFCEGLELEDPYSHLASHSSCDAWTTYLLEPLCLGLGTWHEICSSCPLLSFELLPNVSQQRVRK